MTLSLHRPRRLVKGLGPFLFLNSNKHALDPILAFRPVNRKTPGIRDIFNSPARAALQFICRADDSICDPPGPERWRSSIPPAMPQRLKSGKMSQPNITSGFRTFIENPAIEDRPGWTISSRPVFNYPSFQGRRSDLVPELVLDRG